MEVCKAAFKTFSCSQKGKTRVFFFLQEEKTSRSSVELKALERHLSVLTTPGMTLQYDVPLVDHDTRSGQT